MRPRKEVEEALNEAMDAIDQGADPFPGLTYSDGVQSALEYVLGTTDSKPMEP